MRREKIALPPAVPSKRVNLTVPPRDLARLEKLAAERGQPISTLALELIRSALDALNVKP